MLKHVLPSLIVVSLGLTACHDSPTGTLATKPATPPFSCPTPTAHTAVLVDASHDGGIWWFPQVGPPFDGTQTHQGQALADTLRAMGFRVDEAWRDVSVSLDYLLDYQIVIRAGSFGAYYTGELDAYDAFVGCSRTLILLGHYLRPGEHDDLADRLGIAFVGAVTGDITSFATHPITEGVSALTFLSGTVVDTAQSRSVRVLGWLDGKPVMGIQEGRPAKVFFMGDTNTLESVPQPLVNNLVAWGF